MVSKIVLLATLALATTFAHAFQTNKSNIFTLHTDDSEKLSKLNVSFLAPHINMANTSIHSYDGTGLRLKGVLFHYKPQSMINITSKADLNIHDDPDKRALAICDMYSCAWGGDVQFQSGYQASLIGGTVCPWLTQNLDITSVSVSRFFIDCRDISILTILTDRLWVHLWKCTLCERCTMLTGRRCLRPTSDSGRSTSQCDSRPMLHSHGRGLEDVQDFQGYIWWFVRVRYRDC